MDYTKINEILHSLYYNPSSESGFSSLKKLYHAARKKCEISFSDVIKWLMKQNTYTLHKQKIYIIQRNKVVAKTVNEQY